MLFLAEIADKMVPLEWVYFWMALVAALGAGAAGFLSGRKRRWTLVGLALVALLLTCLHRIDADLIEAVTQELGPDYVWFSHYGIPWSLLLGSLAGALLRSILKPGESRPEI